MTKKPLIHILTPVYNGEDFLEECIMSVLSQSYENWTYTIVDNRSDDNSLNIAKKFAENDSRIEVKVNESHLPVMESLNYTFSLLSKESDYCKVLHADDWMFPECLSRMAEHGETYPEVGIVSSYSLDDTVVRPQGLEYPSFLLNGREVARSYFLNSHKLFAAPSNLLIRSSILLERESVYDLENIHSDHGLCLDVMRTHDFGFVHQLLTFSRRHQKSHTVIVANKYGTYGPGRFKNLQKYGDYFLNKDEINELSSQIIDNCYQSLARKLLFGKSKKIMDYHIRELKGMDKKLNKWKITKGILYELFSIKRNIKGVAKRVNRLKN